MLRLYVFLTQQHLCQLDERFQKKIKSKSDEVLQQTKQTKQTTIFLPKVNKVFLSPILLNLNPFRTDPLDEPKRMPASKKFNLLRMMYVKFEIYGCTAVRMKVFL